MIRLVVCIDVDTDDPAVAYDKVSAALTAASDADPDLEWESSDEWYRGDNGAPGDREELIAARMKIYELHPERFGREKQKTETIAVHCIGGCGDIEVPKVNLETGRCPHCGRDIDPIGETS